MRRWKLTALLVVVALLVLIGATQSSGPAPGVVAADRQPSTTTTTEPLPEGIFVVRIENGSFIPSVLDLDLDRFQVVRWINTDAVPYQITSRQRGDDGEFLFQSAELARGDSFEFDFSTLESGVHRYSTARGAQVIPGLVDTRPSQ